MPLDPEIAAFLGGVNMPTFRSLGVEPLRQMVDAGVELMPKLDVSLAGIRDRVIPGPAGDVPVRIYTPQGRGPFPLLVFCHGGGFITGHLDIADAHCRALCHGAACVVLSVDYRLAPEHKFPAATDDAYAALRWAAAHADALDVDPRRIAVGGDSAGAVLATVSAIRARDDASDDGVPTLCAQMLMYPGSHYPDPEKFPSLRANPDGPLLTTDDVYFCWDNYLRNADDRRNPLAMPAHANHRDLPPAFIASAELDPTRDDAEHYAALLEAAGVPTVLRRYAGMPHGFFSWIAFSARSRAAMDEVCAWLHQRFAAVRGDDCVE
jgi:acetyl esterase